MKIIRITTDNEISVHEFPEGNYREQNKALKSLIGPECEMLEHVMPKRLYNAFGASNTVKKEAGSCANMLVDEEGHYHDLPVNMVGSWLYGTDEHGYPILGNILIAGEYLNGMGIDFSGLSEEQFDLLYPQLERLVEKARNMK